MVVDTHIIYNTEYGSVPIVSLAHHQGYFTVDITPAAKTVTGWASAAGYPALVVTVKITAYLCSLPVNHQSHV